MEKLKEMLKTIKELSIEDDESAHGWEDSMHLYALELIACGHPESVKIAKLALTSSKIKFSRWCA
jgi:hypothetical protein